MNPPRPSEWSAETPPAPGDTPSALDVHAAQVDAVNLPHRPSVGTGEFVYTMALSRWDHHTADQNGRCVAPQCAQAWPCPPATAAEQAMIGCLTWWAVLDCKPLF